ncbi:MAG: DUF58 domain-containing protein [Eubacterium sp.]|nr:DUF58 domain-containing protein [Eubacterium sp.]
MTLSARQQRKLQKERERLKKPLKTVIHPMGFINYGIQLAIALYMYDFLRNFFMMLVVSIIIASPIFDLIGLFFAYRGINVRIKAPEKNVTRNSIGYLKLILENKSIVVSYDTCVKLDTENTFYMDKSGAVLSLPASARKNYEHHIPLKYSMNGIYKFAVENITIRDLMGFISIRKKQDSSAEVNVYPESVSNIELDMQDISKGMTESEETVKKGHDFSDVSDVREYIPGDKLMSIHWKLSAKRDILMVKDRVSMSDQQMVILTEICGADEEVDEILGLTYAVIEKMVREQTYVRLMWWSDGNFAFEERHIMNLGNLKDAFSDIYYEKIYNDSDKTKGYMRSIHPELKAYVNICMKDGKADAVVVEQD